MRGTIDKAKGIIYGVSIATIGEARGHDETFDEETLKGIKELADKKLKGIKIKWTHQAKGLTDWIGNARNSRLEGDQLLADIYVYENSPHRELFLEMAEENPEDFGVSVHIERETDGNKVRPLKLHSADVVENPAANPRGLFAEIENPKEKEKENEGIDKTDTSDKNEEHESNNAHNLKPIETMTEDQIKELVSTAVKDAVESLMAEKNDEYSEKITELEKKLAEIKPDVKAEEKEEQHAEDKEKEMEESKLAEFSEKVTKAINDLTAKFEALPFGPTSGASGGKETPGDEKDFAHYVKQYESEGLSRTDAITKAVNAHPKQYEQARKSGIRF